MAGYGGAQQQYLVVGAPRTGPEHHGRVYVYAGSRHELRFTIDADTTGRALGAMFVAVPGDLDGDDVPDIYASDWSNAARGLSTGVTFTRGAAARGCSRSPASIRGTGSAPARRVRAMSTATAAPT